MRAKRATVGLGLLVLAITGCTDAGQPSPPPEPVDSISDPSATSAPPPPDTESETATETAETTASPTTVAGGPPALPAEAKEQTEAGAEAFVAHYFDLLNYGTMTPDADALVNTGTPQCQTCIAFQQMLTSSAEEETRSDGPVLTLANATAVLTADEAEVSTAAQQLNPAGLGPDGKITSDSREPEDVEFIFALRWEADEWRIQEID